MAILGVGAKAIVTAQMDADYNLGVLGANEGILTVGQMMEREVIDNNTVRVHDGVAFVQGRYIYLEANTYDDFAIENGEQGVTRYDLIGYHLYKSDDAEVCEKFVLKDVGESGTVESEVFRDGGQDVYLPLYRVKIEDLTITEVLLKQTKFKSIQTVMDYANATSTYFFNQIEKKDSLLSNDNNSYFEISNKEVHVNEFTGEVYINIHGKAMVDLPAGQVFNMGNIALDYTPVYASVPVTVAVINDSSGLATALLRKKGVTNESYIRARVHSAIKKDEMIFANAHYFIESKWVNGLLGELAQEV